MKRASFLSFRFHLFVQTELFSNIYKKLFYLFIPTKRSGSASARKEKRITKQKQNTAKNYQIKYKISFISSFRLNYHKSLISSKNPKKKSVGRHVGTRVRNFLHFSSLPRFKNNRSTLAKAVWGRVVVLTSLPEYHRSRRARGCTRLHAVIVGARTHTQ